MKAFSYAALILALSASACGDDSGGGTGGAGTGGAGSGSSESSTGMGGMDMATSGATTSATAASTGSGVEAPPAPVLDAVDAMHGALHVMWTNTTDDCDEVEGERMTADEPYAVIFTTPGTVDNEADGDATDPAVAYTYRLRCHRGDAYSEYSNEITASPNPE